MAAPCSGVLLMWQWNVCRGSTDSCWDGAWVRWRRSLSSLVSLTLASAQLPVNMDFSRLSRSHLLLSVLLSHVITICISVWASTWKRLIFTYCFQTGSEVKVTSTDVKFERFTKHRVVMSSLTSWCHHLWSTAQPRTVYFEPETRRALGTAHLPPTKVFPRLAVNKTILKPCLAAAMGAQYLYVGFSQGNKIPRCSAYDIGESNPVPASGL